MTCDVVGRRLGGDGGASAAPVYHGLVHQLQQPHPRTQTPTPVQVRPPTAHMTCFPRFGVDTTRMCVHSGEQGVSESRLHEADGTRWLTKSDADRMSLWYLKEGLKKLRSVDAKIHPGLRPLTARATCKGGLLTCSVRLCSGLPADQVLLAGHAEQGAEYDGV